MTYTALDISKPVTSPDTRQTSIDAIRNNLIALRDSLIATGIVQGFNYSNLGGTASQPAQLFYKRSTEWIRIDLTWGTTGGEAGNVTKAAFYYSADTGTTYANMVDLSGNFVCTFAYDANSNPTTTTWGSTP